MRATAAATDPAPATLPATVPDVSGHAPVLLAEAVDLLAPAVSERDHSRHHYLDGTFGGGGHTRALLAASAPDGIVLSIDADPAAAGRAAALGAEPGVGERFRFVPGNFRDLAAIARAEGVVPLDGVLLDLGLSSFQLDSPERGFAFRFDGPLDMRFDPARGESAADLVARLPEEELAGLIWRLGEEPSSRRIARALVQAREREPIATTGRLAALVEAAVGGRRGRDTHPATRTFQALRIAVNDELAALEEALAGAMDVLTPGGRLAVIAFHSLEDRIVKAFIARESAECLCPPGLPICACGHRPRLAKVTRKAVRPSPAEVATNPRSRSAVLRVAARLGGSG
jgi:16S rRNA (cytosine1402-N4)-methyltransferase